MYLNVSVDKLSFYSNAPARCSADGTDFFFIRVRCVGILFLNSRSSYSSYREGDLRIEIILPRCLELCYGFLLHHARNVKGKSERCLRGGGYNSMCVSLRFHSPTAIVALSRENERTEKKQCLNNVPRTEALTDFVLSPSVAFIPSVVIAFTYRGGGFAIYCSSSVEPKSHVVAFFVVKLSISLQSQIICLATDFDSICRSSRISHPNLV